MELDFNTVMVKWLKKTKLRDGNHEVGLIMNAFYYRGFPLGYVEGNKIRLKYPASLKENSWPSLDDKEYISSADPKFFITLRKVFRKAMTIINNASVHVAKYPSNPGGRQQPAN